MSARRLSFLAVVLAAGLAGCQTPVVDETGPLAIRSVTVAAQPTVVSETNLVPPLQQAASAALVGGDPLGTPATVAISINSVLYKDPLLSLLIGSANSIGTTVTVVDENGAVLASFLQSEMIDAAFNGVVGAVIAVAQDRAAVDRALVDGYVLDLKTRIYGPPGHVPAKPAPARVAAPQIAPPQPAAPAGGAASPAPIPTS